MKPRFVRGHNGHAKTTQCSKKILTMKTPSTSAKQAALIAVLVLGSSAWVSAQSNQVQTGQPAGGAGSQPEKPVIGISANSRSPQPTRINKASSLIGTTVKNQQGEELGIIRDLAIDFNSGQVAYIVLDGDMEHRHLGMGDELSHCALTNTSDTAEVLVTRADWTGSIVPLLLYPPGFDMSDYRVYDPEVAHWVSGSSGTGFVSSEKLHAVPLRAFQSDATGTSLVLNANKDKLERSEGFAQNNWPPVTTTAWGAEPFWKATERTPSGPEKQDVGLLNNKAGQNKATKEIR